MTGGRLRAIAGLLLAVATLNRATAAEIGFDTAQSHLGFELSTRWGQKLQGRFDRYEGQLIELADGRRQVRLRMFTDAVEIEDHPRYTAWARSPRFFDAEKYPVVDFVSDPFTSDLTVHGGQLSGALSIRGIRRPKTLEVAATTCERPGKDCDIVATGAISRADYDMNDWKLAINDRVVFVLRTRLRENAPP